MPTTENVQDVRVNTATKNEEQPRRPGPDHEHLEVFVGKWQMDGLQYDSPFGPAAAVSAVRHYEWLTGGFFLVHRLEGRLGDHEMACLEIIGHDGSSQTYRAHTFYNDGHTKVWQVRESDGTWTSTADWEKAGESLHVRCTTVFSDAGNTMTAHWEYANDSDRSTWQPFMGATATKT